MSKSTYVAVPLDLTEAQLKKLIDGKRIVVDKSQYKNTGKIFYLHPAQAQNIQRNMSRNSNSYLYMTDGELAETYRQMLLSGGSFFSNLWKGLKSVFKTLKDTGALTALADQAVAPLSAFTGQPAIVGAVRKGLKDVTGVGMPPSGQAKRMPPSGQASRMTKAQRMEQLKARGLYLS